MSTQALNFADLVAAIQHTHVALADQAAKAVNTSLTLRNWVFGYYSREYEQSGADRSAYGERLLETLAQRLQQTGLQRVEARELRRYRQFYLAYPQIREMPSPESALPAVPAQQLVERLSFSHFAELVQYALADMSNQLFVSRYQVQLPGKAEMAAFLHKAVEELGGGDE